MLPMIASRVLHPFNDPDWLFEIKWDGFRLVSVLDKGKVQLKSRNGNSLNTRFSLIQEALRRLVSFDAIFDGEAIMMDSNGYSNFDKLLYDSSSPALKYIVFDILAYRGKSLLKVPLIERKALLKDILPLNERVGYCDHIQTAGIDFFELAKQHSLEGIVGKKMNSIYKPGETTKDWVKIKNLEYCEQVGMRQRFQLK